MLCSFGDDSARTAHILRVGFPMIFLAKVRAGFARLLYGRFFKPANVDLHPRTRLNGWPLFACAAGSKVTIAEGAVLCSEPSMTALGVRQPVIFRTLTPTASITIGKDCGFSGTTVVAAKSVTIGNGCMLGANAMIFDTDFHNIHSKNRRYEKVDWELISAPVRIGDNVFIGTGAIVCKGVEIGENSVIGAGSVVTKSIPANSIAAGNPCRVVGTVGDGAARDV